MSTLSTDLTIIGGGPVGMTAALLVARLCPNFNIVISDSSKENAPVADKTIVLTYASKSILEEAGIWEDLADIATPITRIEISHERKVFSELILMPKDCGSEFIGYSIPLARLISALRSASVASKNIQLLVPATATSLEEHSDHALTSLKTLDGKVQINSSLTMLTGGENLLEKTGISIKKINYKQRAVTANLSLDESVLTSEHEGVALEKIGRDQVTALVPRSNGYGLICCGDQNSQKLPSTNEHVKHLCQELFPNIFPNNQKWNFEIRGDFNLGLQFALPMATNRIFLGGSIAHSLHPIGAQGLNLGLRDAATFAELLQYERTPNKNTLAQLSRKYRNLRRIDRLNSIAFTHMMARMIGAKSKNMEALSALGNLAISMVPLARKHFARTMVFGLDYS